MQMNAIMQKCDRISRKRRVLGCPLVHKMKKRIREKPLKGFLLAFCIK